MLTNRKRAMKTYKVSEIVGPTIQGEGFHSGYPCALLRFSGCNLWDDKDSPSPVCPFCDTESMHSFTEMTSEDIINHVKRVMPKVGGLIITGGEPLLQLDERLLLDLLNVADWIDIETNGSVDPMFDVDHPLIHNNYKQGDYPVFFSVSPKTLNSLSGLMVRRASWIKILIPDKEYLLQGLKDLCPVRTSKEVYLQPVMPKGGSQCAEYKKALQICLKLSWETGSPISLQTHRTMCLP